MAPGKTQALKCCFPFDSIVTTTPFPLDNLPVIIFCFVDLKSLDPYSFPSLLKPCVGIVLC